MSKKVAFIFPGQGCQYVGMGYSLYQEFEMAKLIYQEAEEILGLPLRTVCFEGPIEELTKTQIAQPAILTVEYILFTLLKEAGFVPSWVAGHSLGEYAALIASGAVSFADALYLVGKRSEHMAAVSAEGGMAAILNFPATELTEMVKDLQAEGIIELANFNSPFQIVVSGEKKMITKLITKIKQGGKGKAIPLGVQGAFHSSIMKPAAEKFRKDLKSIRFFPFKTPFISNVTAEEVSSSDQLPLLLEKQIYSPVRWEEIIKKMASLNCNSFVELGGKILSGMVKKTFPGATTFSIREAEDVKIYLQN